MKNVLFFGFFILFLSCKNTEDKQVETKKKDSTSVKGKKFEMYQASEMASLMEQMYAHNSAVKEKISSGESIGEFPEFFNKIYTAKFTDESDNDDFFKENAKKYIAAQMLIYSNPKSEKENFNKGVDACITCHEGKCGGPITRIKKLYIK